MKYASWRGGRAVECGGLENRYGRKLIGGSNRQEILRDSKRVSAERIARRRPQSAADTERGESTQSANPTDEVDESLPLCLNMAQIIIIIED